MATKVLMYGAAWCGDTKRSRRLLDRLGVAYDYIDVEQDKEASSWVRAQNNGKEKKPTIMIGGRLLTEPSDAELERVLRENGAIPADTSVEMVTDGVGG